MARAPVSPSRPSLAALRPPWGVGSNGWVSISATTTVAGLLASGQPEPEVISVSRSSFLLGP